MRSSRSLGQPLREQRIHLYRYRDGEHQRLWSGFSEQLLLNHFTGDVWEYIGGEGLEEFENSGLDEDQFIQMKINDLRTERSVHLGDSEYTIEY